VNAAPDGSTIDEPIYGVIVADKELNLKWRLACRAPPCHASYHATRSFGKLRGWSWS